MCHMRHRLRIFLFRTKIMFRSQDIQVFVYLTIPSFIESVTSRWVLVHGARYIFKYIFWGTTHEVTKLGQWIDISKGINFLESFEQCARFQGLFHLGTCPNYPLTNYVKIPLLHFFEKVNKGQLKIININH